MGTHHTFIVQYVGIGLGLGLRLGPSPQKKNGTCMYTYTIHNFTFGGDFNFALWWGGLGTANLKLKRPPIDVHALQGMTTTKLI